MPYRHGITRRYRLGVDPEITLGTLVGCLFGTALFFMLAGVGLFWSATW